MQWRGNYSIFGQGRKDRKRQNREREKKVFAGYGAFFCPENKRSSKKRSSPDLERFSVPKMAQDTGIRGGGKSRPGGRCSPTSHAYAEMFLQSAERFFS